MVKGNKIVSQNNVKIDKKSIAFHILFDFSTYSSVCQKVSKKEVSSEGQFQEH